MKILKLLLLLLICTVAVYAQDGYYQPFSASAGYGVTVANAGEQTLTSSNAANLNLSYYFTPFVSVSFEGQFGKLTGGDAMHDAFAKQFVNSYSAFMVHFDVQAGEFIDYSQSPFLNGLKNIYAGIGAGTLQNKITNIQTINPDAAATSPLTYLATSSNIVVPLRLGYEIKIFNKYDEPQFRFDIGYSLNTAFGKGLDGYTSIYTKASINYYSYIFAGLKYSFGPVHTYRKPVYGKSF